MNDDFSRWLTGSVPMTRTSGQLRDGMWRIQPDTSRVAIENAQQKGQGNNRTEFSHRNNPAGDMNTPQPEIQFCGLGLNQPGSWQKLDPDYPGDLDPKDLQDRLSSSPDGIDQIGSDYYHVDPAKPTKPSETVGDEWDWCNSSESDVEAGNTSRTHNARIGRRRPNFHLMPGTECSTGISSPPSFQ